MRSTRTYLVVNRARSENSLIAAQAGSLGLEVLAFIPEDENVGTYDAQGRPLLDIPDTSPSLTAVREMVRRLFD